MALQLSTLKRDVVIFARSKVTHKKNYARNSYAELTAKQRFELHCQRKVASKSPKLNPLDYHV